MTYDLQQTVARLLTPPGRGGIAVIALAGPDAQRILEQLFETQTSGGNRSGEVPEPLPHRGRWPASGQRGDADAGALQLGKLVANGETIDEAIVTATPGGLEINIHGGPAATRRTLQRLTELGAAVRTDQPPSLLNPTHPTWNNPAIGEELLAALPTAPSLFAAACLTNQWSGGLSELVTQAIDALQRRSCRTPLNECSDGEELRSTAELLREASGGYATVHKLLNPPEVVLAGPPNAGKSTLANVLIGRPVSIVHATAGTTRDWIREQAVLDGRAVWLTDTAGLWHADDDACGIAEGCFAEQDAEAVRRAWTRIDAADLVLLCHPADAPAPNLPRPIHAPPLTIRTKADLNDANDAPTCARRSVRTAASSSKMRDTAGAAPYADESGLSSIHNSELIIHNFPVSAETGLGLPALRTAILTALNLADIDPATPRAFTQRQAELLTVAAGKLGQSDPDNAVQTLQNILF